MSYLKGLMVRFCNHFFVFSPYYAFLELLTVVDRIVSKNTHKPLSKSLLEKKKRWILCWAHIFFKDEIERYKTLKFNFDNRNQDPFFPKIWICWLQGEESAPDLVKKMISRLRENANGHEVVLLDKDNWNQYCNLPRHIVEKYSRGLMPNQQFADILRVALLRQNGGLWVDGTVLTLKPIPDEVFQTPIFNIKNIDKDFDGYNRVADADKYQCYFISSQPNSLTYSFLDDCFSKYWSKYDTLVDYFLISYLAKIAREDIAGCAFEYSLIPDNNYLCEILHDYLMRGEEFDPNILKSFFESDTWLYKLTWKSVYPLVSVSGKPTLASVMFNEL